MVFTDLLSYKRQSRGIWRNASIREQVEPRMSTLPRGHRNRGTRSLTITETVSKTRNILKTMEVVHAGCIAYYGDKETLKSTGRCLDGVTFAHGELYLIFASVELYLIFAYGELYLIFAHGELYLIFAHGALYLIFAYGELYLIFAHGELYLIFAHGELYLIFAHGELYLIFAHAIKHTFKKNTDVIN
ncbi:hypothetical protein BgiBS90_023199 [Biomphalaria glabrata]|nr:hypothetical protein BgiBS90_023199 [Biomphalaria glabrata]